MCSAMTVEVYLNVMQETERIFGMFENALQKEMTEAGLKMDDINSAIRDLQNAYRRISPSRQISSINYDGASYRAAYLYLYAGCHAAAVYSELTCLMHKHPVQFAEMMRYDMSELHICSLGGGPGCDVVGLLHSRLHKGRIDRTTSIRCTVVDLCPGWGIALQHVRDVYVASLGNLRRMVQFNFRQANLCSGSPRVDEISTAHIVSMVKYVSVVSFYYARYPNLLEMIFWRMKPGAYVFFLDNSAGGFYEMTYRAATKAGLLLIAPPIFRRWKFLSQNDDHKFFSRSLRTTSVVCAIWIKGGAEPLIRLPAIFI